MLEIYILPDNYLWHSFMRKNSPILPTNCDWERLSLKPITLAKLKPRLRSGTVRVVATVRPGLRFMSITRHPLIAGRKAKRVEQGFFEVYESGVGWVKISNECLIWLQP